MKLLALLVMAGSAASAQDGVEYLKQVDATIRSVRTYDMDWVSANQWEGSVIGLDAGNSRMHVAGASGGRWRLANGDEFTVSDGHQVWQYSAAYHAYTRRPVDLELQGPWRLTLDQVKSARIVRTETLDLADGAVHCTVVESQEPFQSGRDTQAQTVTYWIDTVRLLPLKRVSQTVRGGNGSQTFTQTDTVTRLSLNLPLADTLFRFTPPAGAVEVREFAPSSPLVGKQSPDFEMTDAAGNRISPATLRGHVTVLNFAFGNGQDTAQPFLEMLYRNLQRRGVTVLLVGYSPSRNWSAQMKQAGYTVPLVTAGGFSAAHAFNLDTSSFVVLDRDGTVRYWSMSDNGRQQGDILRILRTIGVL